MGRLAVVPCAVFAFFSALCACVALIDFFPTSAILWWANIELFPRFRTLFYVMESVISPDPVILGYLFGASACTTALIATTLLGNGAKRHIAFLGNHLAALVIGISMFSTRTAPTAASYDGFVISGRELLGPILSEDNGVNLIMLVAAVASCCASHYVMSYGPKLVTA